MIEDCKYFSVYGETEDFVTIKLNVNEQFNGRYLICLIGQEIADFAQYLLDEHRIAMIGHGGSSILCRKVKE